VIEMNFPSASAVGFDSSVKIKPTKGNRTYVSYLKPLGDRVLVEPVEEKEVKKAASSFPIPPRKNQQRVSSSRSARAKPTTTARKSRLKSKKVIAC